MPGYHTREQEVAIHGAASLRIRSLLDNQQFSDERGMALAQGISSAAWPLFGVLWPSARRLADLMAARPLQPQERILEVGCGLALASLVSHRRGADVTASDCHPLAGEFLRENLRLNALPPLPYRHGPWSGLDATTPDPVTGRFALIIGSDVLYERDDSGQLAGFIERHALPVSEVLIVDPNRGNRAAFNRRMADAGYGLVDTDLSTPDAGAGAYRGRLLHYRRDGTPGLSLQTGHLATGAPPR